MLEVEHIHAVSLNPVHTITSCFLRSILIVFSSVPKSPKWSLSLRLFSWFSIQFSSPPFLLSILPSPLSLIWSLIIFDEKYELWISCSYIMKLSVADCGLQFFWWPYIFNIFNSLLYVKLEEPYSLRVRMYHLYCFCTVLLGIILRCI
jgi:hypothetical protein